MATTFIETPDATRDTKFWDSVIGTVVYDSTTTPKSGIASWKFGDAGVDQVNYLQSPAGVLADAGTRISCYVRINDLPSANAILLNVADATISTSIFSLILTTTGVLQVGEGNTPTQIGSNGGTLSTGVWYRLTFSFKITSTTVYSVKVYIDSVQSISVSNSTALEATGSSILLVGFSAFGVTGPGANKFANVQHIYIDNITDLSDPGDIRITSKRPNANGTTNGFTTQIGSGGSGYGTGHSPQVNEQPLSTTNGWSMIGAGSAITEEYNIENVSTGDVDITGQTIVDYTGWVYAKALVNETASIIVNNVTSNIALTSTITMFTKIAGSSTYPAGSGKDIGIITTTALTTVSLYECGIMVAYMAPTPATTAQINPAIQQLVNSGGFIGKVFV